MMRRKSGLFTLVVQLVIIPVVLGFLFYHKSGLAMETADAKADSMKMKIMSPAFPYGEFIPLRYTCNGANISPALEWDGAPEETKALALTVDDPDAPSGDWVHWVVYNIPASYQGLPEGVTGTEMAADGIMQARNSFGKENYGGPCPPHGHGPHRYFFKLYALDTTINHGGITSMTALENAMDGHILAQTGVMGRFERK